MRYNAFTGNKINIKFLTEPQGLPLLYNDCYRGSLLTFWSKEWITMRMWRIPLRHPLLPSLRASAPTKWEHASSRMLGHAHLTASAQHRGSHFLWPARPGISAGRAQSKVAARSWQSSRTWRTCHDKLKRFEVCTLKLAKWKNFRVHRPLSVWMNKQH